MLNDAGDQQADGRSSRPRLSCLTSALGSGRLERSAIDCGPNRKSGIGQERPFVILFRRESCDSFFLLAYLGVTMPGLAIELNGTHVSTISLSGMDVVDVSVHGALDRNPRAALDAMGGNYADGGCGHLIWVTEKSHRQVKY